ncbi:hypothetical protein ABXN37_16815 [Piscinibacter sakaiensis]|uniref:nicotinate-nicotinamide nucleotide adenylyltransferase n=1 Tax=Piscinibacter sakaiensis TaxID=1547922 RepID=UPI003726E502
MLRLAVADPDAGDPRFVVDDLEIRRHGPSYTIDTVEALQAAHPGTAWVLLIGEDQWRRLPTWHRWRELLARVTLAVARRPASRCRRRWRTTRCSGCRCRRGRCPPRRCASASPPAGRSTAWSSRRSRAILNPAGCTATRCRPAPTPPGAEWTSANCNAPSSTASKTSRARTSPSSIPSTCPRCSSG